MSSSPSPRAPSRPSGSVREGPDQKRLRILEAARRVCAREGYEAATMDAVAAEAHVSKGTLYNYFENKEHLFLSTLLQSYDEVESRIAARIGPDEDPRQHLEGYLEALVDVFPLVAAGMMVNLQVWAVVSRDASERVRMFEDLRGRYARTSRDLETTLAAGQRAGVFRRDFSPETVAGGLSAVFDGFVYRSVFDPEHANAEGLRAAFDALMRERVLARAPGGEGGR